MSGCTGPRILSLIKSACILISSGSKTSSSRAFKLFTSNEKSYAATGSLVGFAIIGSFWYLSSIARFQKFNALTISRFLSTYVAPNNSKAAIFSSRLTIGNSMRCSTIATCPVTLAANNGVIPYESTSIVAPCSSNNWRISKEPDSAQSCKAELPTINYNKKKLIFLINKHVLIVVDSSSPFTDLRLTLALSDKRYCAIL